MNSNPIKPKKSGDVKGCLLIFVVIGILIIIGAALSGGEDKNTVATTTSNYSSSAKTDVNTTTSTTQQQKAGIDPDAFHKTVTEKIKEINTNNLIGKISTEVYGETGYVELYLTDLSSWSYTSDVEKKEFMNTFGNLMDSIASITAYPGTKTIGTSTRLYSPGGLELAERTVWGNVKLK